MKHTGIVITLLVTLGAATGCGRVGDRIPTQNACDVVLAPHQGSEELDARIRQAQEAAKRSNADTAQLRKLGWLFVAKARTSSDAGFFRLAAECARCLQEKAADDPDAGLLLGHALHNLHRFREAEHLARQLVRQRSNAFDHGLLGDVLVDQGRLMEAAQAYQRMLDLRPSLQSYSRAAHLLWLRGDLDGAIRLFEMAARAGSARDGESVAWVYSRLGMLRLLEGNLPAARLSSETALAFQRGYPAALALRGRIELAEGKAPAAVVSLKSAASGSPLPEIRWLLADALRMSGSDAEAREIETVLLKSGALEDPRTTSLYLSTRGLDPETALRLAREEISNRADVFTQDALAWALASAGNLDEAAEIMERALAHGTPDPRLYFHAGTIARARGLLPEARVWLRKAEAMQQALFPSERERLKKETSTL